VPLLLAEPEFAPSARFESLPIPQITTAGDLAAWLGVTVPELDWFADARHQHKRASDTALQHYRYTFIAKSTGLPRLLEAPKPRLKAIQRKILHEILDAVPVHDTAHGFVKGRSVLSAAALHAGEAVVIAADIQNFFPAIAIVRIRALFRALGYPWSVTHLLAGLCTTTTPHDVLGMAKDGKTLDWHARNALSGPHLPQGAPTSPALANLCAFALDQRLTGLVARFGARYTRYADDLAFSGSPEFAKRSQVFLTAVGEIARDEGFALNAVKTRVMRAAMRQQVTGIVVNTHSNVRRADYDVLKATLTNCAHRGPLAENRDGHADFRAHLNGRVNWVETVNPARGAKLRALFDAIAWD
jgi:hypothetical protein